MKYYVGMSYVGKEREVHIHVKGCSEEAKHLERVRTIEADSTDEAARKYIELITGKTAGIRRPS